MADTEHTGHTGDGRDRAGPTAARPRVLLTLSDVPYPADAGKRMRSRAVLEALAPIADVDLVVVVGAAPPTGFSLPDDVSVDRHALVVWATRSPLAAAVRVLRHLVPWQIAVHDLAEARDVVTGWHDPPYDLVWFGSLDHAHELGRHIVARRTVIDADDVETEKLRAFLRLPPDTGASTRADRVQRRIELPLWWWVQRRAARRADRIVVASGESVKRFAGGRAVGRIAVVPNGYPDPGPPARLADAAGEGPPTLLLVANYDYDPNLDAATFCARDIVPLVRAAEPTARLVLVGRGPARLRELGAEPGVEVLGLVDDVAPLLATATVAVVPVRYGSGTRLKVLEAFAHGVPVVSTALGCEGLGATYGHLAIADTPEAFAAACLDVIRDPVAAEVRARAARGLYEKRFRPEAAASAVRRIVGEALA